MCVSSYLQCVGFISQGCRDYPEEIDEIMRDTARSGVVR